MGDDKHKPKDNEEAPRAEGKNEPVAFDPSPLLARIEKLEGGLQLLKDGVDFVRGTNWFILVVLFVGFLALMVSFISGVIQATNTSIASQVSLMKSIDQLTNELNSLKFNSSQSTNSGNTK